MKKINSSTKFLIEIHKFQNILSRRLDSILNGISLNEFIILYYLSRAEEQKIRRIDLAEKLGLTASGVTRLLLPMEKIGLIIKEANEHDARVSFVKLANGGKTKLEEGIERIEIFCEDLINEDKVKIVEDFSKLLSELNKNI